MRHDRSNIHSSLASKSCGASFCEFNSETRGINSTSWRRCAQGSRGPGVPGPSLFHRFGAQRRGATVEELSSFYSVKIDTFLSDPASALRLAIPVWTWQIHRLWRDAPPPTRCNRVPSPYAVVCKPGCPRWLDLSSRKCSPRPAMGGWASVRGATSKGRAFGSRRGASATEGRQLGFVQLHHYCLVTVCPSQCHQRCILTVLTHPLLGRVRGKSDLHGAGPLAQIQLALERSFILLLLVNLSAVKSNGVYSDFFVCSHSTMAHVVIVIECSGPGGVLSASLYHNAQSAYDTFGDEAKGVCAYKTFVRGKIQQNIKRS